jgi:poly-gamma-glutamate synthesis protein (capsule biosynthesis protein)
VVIGHHAHVAQGWETWQQSLIFYGLGDFCMDEVWGGRFAQYDWSYLLRLVIRDHKVAGAELTPYERVDDRIRLLGACRDPSRCRRYLENLRRITASEEYRALWQEIAVELFYRVQLPETVTILPTINTWARGLRPRIRQTLQAGRFLARLWSGADREAALPATSALTWLNLARCESHRSVLETALAVLGGDEPDFRTPATRRVWRELTREMPLL